jgi:hypothetical protein
MASRAAAEQENPHTIKLTAAADATLALTGETTFKLAVTRANAILQSYYAPLEFSESCVALQINNGSTGGEYILYSVDDGRSWPRLNAGQVMQFEPTNTTREPGNGFFCLYRVLIIASAVTAYVEVTPHFGRG